MTHDDTVTTVRDIRREFDRIYDAQCAGDPNGDVTIRHGGRYVAGDSPACPAGQVLAGLGVPVETLAGFGDRPVRQLALADVLDLTPDALRALTAIQEASDRTGRAYGTWRLLWHRTAEAMNDWAWGTDQAWRLSPPTD